MCGPARNQASSARVKQLSKRKHESEVIESRAGAPAACGERLRLGEPVGRAALHSINSCAYQRT